MPTYMWWLLYSSCEQPCARPSAQCLMARQHLHNWLGHAAAAGLRRALSSRGRVVADANLQGLESHDERRMYFNVCLQVRAFACCGPCLATRVALSFVAGVGPHPRRARLGKPAYRPVHMLTRMQTRAHVGPRICTHAHLYMPVLAAGPHLAYGPAPRTLCQATVANGARSHSST